MKEIKNVNWHWLIIILSFVFCIEFFMGLFIALMLEIVLIVFLPNMVEGKNWSFFIYA